MARRQAKNTAERQKLMKEVQSLLYNTRRREQRIREESRKGSPAFRGKTYKSIKRRTKGGLRGKSVKQLQSLKNDLLYVKSLPTSYVSGYNKYKPIFDEATKSLGRNLTKEVYQIWNRLVNEGGVYAIYKYELFNEIAKSYELGNRSELKIKERVDRLVKEWYEHDNGLEDRYTDLYDLKDDLEDSQDVLDSITSNDSERYDDPNKRPKPTINVPSTKQSSHARRRSTKNPNRRRKAKR